MHAWIGEQPTKTGLDALERHLGQRQLRLRRTKILLRETGEAVGDQPMQIHRRHAAVRAAKRENRRERSAAAGAAEGSDDS